MATARKLSTEEQRELLAQLEVPFDPAMVEWKVVRRARSGRRGAYYLSWIPALTPTGSIKR